MKQLTMLVTGAGAVLGQGVIRSLRMAHRDLRIITADPDCRAAGHWLGDSAVTIPMATDPAYLAIVEEVIRTEGIDILLIGTDVELMIFSRERQRLEAAYGIQVVVSTTDVVEIADDKLLTARFLEREGFPFAQSASADDRPAVDALTAACGFPLLAKPKHGARSIGVAIINSADELSAYHGREDFVIQEFLPAETGEYTAGCLVFDGTCVATIVLRRDLRDGNTYRAYGEPAGRFDAEIAAIAERLGCHGPCNFQFRVRNGRPVIFEINARFSGTTPIRAMFGFNEVMATVDYLTTATPISGFTIREGAVFRAWSDIFVDAQQLASFNENGTNDSPACTEYPFRSL